MEVPQRAVSPEKPRSEEPIQKEQPVAGDKKEDAPIQKDKRAVREKRKNPLKKRNTLSKMSLFESRSQRASSAVSDDRYEKYKKNGMAWKETTEEVEGWLDYGLIDGLLETISQNKNIIAVAVAAFWAGFYVPQKLRSNGRRDGHSTAFCSCILPYIMLLNSF